MYGGDKEEQSSFTPVWPRKGATPATSETVAHLIISLLLSLPLRSSRSSPRYVAFVECEDEV